MKSRLISLVGIVAAWFVLDYVFHGVLLMPEYMATMNLWRPAAEMNTALSVTVMVLSALSFVFIYCRLVPNKTLENGIKLGAFVGALVAIYAGVGPYIWLPITTKIAAVWAIANFVKFTAAGAIVGYVVTDNMD